MRHPLASAITTLAIAPILQAQGTYVVSSTTDGPDANVGDGICADATGACTLRAAIMEANADPAAARITFDLPGSGPFVLRPGEPYDTIVAPLEIDGYSQAGSAPNTNPPSLGGSNAVI